jgi:hypothetical protein
MSTQEVDTVIIVEWRTKDKVFQGKLLDIKPFDYVVETSEGVEEVPRRCCSIVEITPEEEKKPVSDERIDWDNIIW